MWSMLKRRAFGRNLDEGLSGIVKDVGVIFHVELPLVPDVPDASSPGDVELGSLLQLLDDRDVEVVDLIVSSVGKEKVHKFESLLEHLSTDPLDESREEGLSFWGWMEPGVMQKDGPIRSEIGIPDGCDPNFTTVPDADAGFHGFRLVVGFGGHGVDAETQRGREQCFDVMGEELCISIFRGHKRSGKARRGKVSENH